MLLPFKQNPNKFGWIWAVFFNPDFVK
jgi:hypothetical protein